MKLNSIDKSIPGERLVQFSWLFILEFIKTIALSKIQTVLISAWNS